MLLRLSVSGPRRPVRRAAATSVRYSLFAFCSLSPPQLLQAGYLLLSLRSTLSPASSLSSLTHSTSQPPKGINGEPKKAHCTYSAFLVVGRALWLRSDCFGTSQPRPHSKPPFGSPSHSTAECSAGCSHPLARGCFTPCLAPYRERFNPRLAPYRECFNLCLALYES